MLFGVGKELDGAILEVVWAKPPDRTITRYVKSVVKMGSQGVPTAGNVHQNIVAAASQMFAANTAQSMTTNLHNALSPGLAPIPHGTVGVGGGYHSAYTGFPFIDPSAGGPSQHLVK